MDKVLYTVRHIVDTSGDTCIIKYYLLENESDFGICLCLIKNGKTADKAEIIHFSGSRQEAISFLKLLSGGSVTPASVSEISEDGFSA